jgi:hypothetical protein
MNEAYGTLDVGLGTAYERLVIYRLLDRWFADRPVSTALDGVVDGMGGIPGVHLLGLARRGTKVTVCLPDRKALSIVRDIYRTVGVEDKLVPIEAAGPGAGKFDLVMTFNALQEVDDWRAHVQKLAGWSGRWLVVSVTSPFSWGVQVRKLQRLIQPAGRPERYAHPAVFPANLVPELQRVGRIVDEAYVDCPWWPDHVVSAGTSIFDALSARVPLIGAQIASRARRGDPDAFRFGPGRFPYFEGMPGYEELLRLLAKHPAFDGRGSLLGRVFGHHHAWLIDVSK